MLLRQLEPFKVTFQLQTKLNLKAKWHLAGWEEFKVPTNKIWEVLSGVFYHITGADTYLMYNQYIPIDQDTHTFWMDRVLSAQVTEFYPFDMRGTKLFLNEWDYFIFGGAAGSGFCIRYIETDI